MPLPFHTFRKMPFNHSFLFKGIEFCIFQLSSFIALSIHAFGRGWMLHAKLFFYHPALPGHSILRKNYSTLIHPFGRGLVLYISIYLSRIPIILHCSIHPCFWEGCMLHAKLFFYHPALLCHSLLLGKTILPLFTPYSLLWEGIGFIYISLSRISSIILHCSINP